MRIFNKIVYSKFDVFVIFERVIILETKGQIKKKWIPFIWVTRMITYTCIYSLYYIYIYIYDTKCYIYVSCLNKCEDIHYSFNFFLHPICESLRKKTLLIFVYV